MGGAGNSGSEPVISGVSLAQYAAVTAALGEAFPLKAVLGVEGLDTARWAAADRGWTKRLDEDASLLGRYQVELAAAQDRLARSVEPIDTDLGAWLSFLATLARAPNPDEMLEGHGIGPDDVSRLQRRWDARMREDPTLERRAVELRNQGPGPLPRLRVVKGKLTRSTTGAAPLPAAPSPPAPTALPVAPQPVAPPPVAPPPPPPAPPVASPWAAIPRIAAPDPEEGEEAGTLVAAARAGTTLPFQAAPSPAFLAAMDRPAAAPGQGSDGSTVALRGAASLRALRMHEDEPVAKGRPSTPPPVLPFQSIPKIHDDDEDDEPPLQTVAILSPFTGEALPFTPAAEPDDEEARRRAAALKEGTVMMELPVRPAAPSRDDATRMLPDPRLESGPPGATITGMRSPFARKALPFGKTDPFRERPPEPSAGDDRSRETREPRRAARLPRVPPAPPPPEALAAPEPPAPLPPGEPPLSLERHASLCLELALDPAHAADVLARYQVSPVLKQRADDFYRARLAADPELRAQWNRAFEIYRAWFTSQQG